MILEIIILAFIIIFWNEGKHDAVISGGKLSLKDSQLWHKLDFINWALIGSIVSLCFGTFLWASGESLYLLKGILLLISIAALRIVVFNPRINGLLGVGFFYIGKTSKYDIFVRRLGKLHWFLYLAVLIINYLIIKFI